MTAKIAIVVDPNLPTGLLANAIAVVAFSIGAQRPDLCGPALRTADDLVVPGVVSIPMPVLTAPAERLNDIHGRVVALGPDSGLVVIGFTEQAQRPQTYDTYAATIAATPAAELSYRALALHGPRKALDRLVGNLPLLKGLPSAAP